MNVPREEVQHDAALLHLGLGPAYGRYGINVYPVEWKLQAFLSLSVVPGSRPDAREGGNLII